MNQTAMMTTVLCILPVLAQADVITIEGTITSIDMKGRTVTIEADAKERTLDVSRKVKVSVSGKAATLKSLKSGQEATISYHDELEIVLKIEATNDNGGFVSLFDGKTLEGWDGNELWTVKDGAIVGECPAGAGGLLVSKRRYSNFIFKLRFKLHTGNSGIFFRDYRRSNGSIVALQAEIGYIPRLPLNKGKDFITGAVNAEIGAIHPDSFAADMPEALKPQILASTQPADWSDYVITAQGDRIAVEVNGHTTVDFRNPRVEKDGLIRLQVHGGGTKIEFKDICIKELPE